MDDLAPQLDIYNCPFFNRVALTFLSTFIGVGVIMAILMRRETALSLMLGTTLFIILAIWLVWRRPTPMPVLLFRANIIGLMIIEGGKPHADPRYRSVRWDEVANVSISYIVETPALHIELCRLEPAHDTASYLLALPVPWAFHPLTIITRLSEIRKATLDDENGN